ncbi:Zinc-type alcohol dehydrogenase-like protein [Fusarium oxysporum f. sp. albedinis]|nr:Zinc-type alcohol dehydrogenase-like protein [Fusarium oxysporum f. sp. albedinis]
MSSTHRCYSFCSAAEDTVNRQAQSHPGQPKRCQDISDKARKYSVLARLREPSSGMPRESLASDFQDAFRDNLIYTFVERDDHASGDGDGNRRRVLESEERSGWRSEQGPNP